MSENRQSKSTPQFPVPPAAIAHRDVNYIFRTKPPGGGSRILDCGCESGTRTLAVYQKGYRNITGIDASAHNIALARYRARKHQAEVSFVESSPWAAPFAPGTFTTVLLLGNLFGHGRSPRDDVELLVEMRRLLAASGVLWLSSPEGTGASAASQNVYDRRDVTALLHLLGFQAISLHGPKGSSAEPEGDMGASRLLVHCLAPGRW